ncbi:MAG: TldD/PmbA family protein [Thermodesulfovibrionales bacterium]|nr:TldD/PmbA family protein [Thermodesulfovibrionales bacterium]
MLSEDLLSDILTLALAGGGSYADVFVEQKSPLSIVVEDSSVERISTGQVAGVGIRLIFGEHRVAYAVSNDMSPDALKEAARSLARMASSGEGDEGSGPSTLDLKKARPGAEFDFPVRPGDVDIKDRLSMMLEADRLARAVDPAIRQVRLVYRDMAQSVQIANSEGVLASETRVHTLCMVQAVAERDGVVQTGSRPVAGLRGFDIFDDEPLHEAALEAAGLAARLLGARRAPGGRMPVVISSEAGGTMIHEAIGHGLEGDLAGQGLSKFSGKVGELVASPLVSVVDDATLAGRRGSYGFDDEGVPSRRTVLVRDGVLVSFMHDRISAARAGQPLTGNGRRESYLKRPIPRMSNTFIAPGPDDPARVLSETPEGLLVRKMGGGQVNTVNGDFVFDVMEGYMIRDGKPGELVRGATLTGNGPEALMAIDMVGSDLGFSIGTCGKDAQGVPVSDAMPTLRIPELVVGGEHSG